MQFACNAFLFSTICVVATLFLVCPKCYRDNTVVLCVLVCGYLLKY